MVNTWRQGVAAIMTFAVVALFGAGTGAAQEPVILDDDEARLATTVAMIVALEEEYQERLHDFTDMSSAAVLGLLLEIAVNNHGWSCIRECSVVAGQVAEAIVDAIRNSVEEFEFTVSRDMTGTVSLKVVIRPRPIEPRENEDGDVVIADGPVLSCIRECIAAGAEYVNRILTATRNETVPFSTRIGRVFSLTVAR